MVGEMNEELRDIVWLETVSDGLELAQRERRMVLLHPCGQGIGSAGDL